ncbi:hypothetical protein [Pantoea sp. GD03673]|uniref:T6SS effector phospholipase Tle3 domain-containing protein n=1 Tax=Pantoea sp. GD03673 TaxID=2975364 RepID=UPI002447ABA6|nr:hypothetical protein [Pantoea sp. GD03673]MDH2067228.1 hypothetical protein [Pantoea sp. GD03673]
MKQRLIPFSVQFVNSELDRLLANAPARHYYAHAARLLADLLETPLPPLLARLWPGKVHEI